MNIQAFETVVRENDIPPLKRDRLLKKMRKLEKRGRLSIPNDPAWVWRLSAANLMNGDTSFWGWEYRSKWALDLARNGCQFKKWQGDNEKCVVFAEQGIGDEIIFLRVAELFFDQCPKGVMEVDDRLLPIAQRSFPDGKFISRWRRGRGVGNQLEDYEKNEFDSFVPMADLFHLVFKNRKPDGKPYLKCDPDLRYDLSLRYGDKIGISWKGGRSEISPEEIKCNALNLQYGKDFKEEESPDWCLDLNLDHNDMEQIFAIVGAVKEVRSVFSYMCHVAGSQGKLTRAIRPPFKQMNNLATGNNRLKWVYGTGKEKWKCPWYNSMTVYENTQCLRSELY